MGSAPEVHNKMSNAKESHIFVLFPSAYKSYIESIL